MPELRYASAANNAMIAGFLPESPATSRPTCCSGGEAPAGSGEGRSGWVRSQHEPIERTLGGVQGAGWKSTPPTGRLQSLPHRSALREH